MNAINASLLFSEQRPLDALRLELQNEPAFCESTIPKDDHTLTRSYDTIRLCLFTPPRDVQAPLEGPWIQRIPGKEGDP
jgi:hypothetical protein